MRLVALSAVLLFSASASAQPTFSPDPWAKSEPQLAIPVGHNLVIFRASAEPFLWSPTVKVDGVKIVALPNESYTSTKVSAGPHKVTLAWPFVSGQRGASIGIDVKADGTVHFMEITGIARYAGGAYQVMYFEIGSGIAEARPEYARNAIAACCKLKPATSEGR